MNSGGYWLWFTFDYVKSNALKNIERCDISINKNLIIGVKNNAK